MSPATSSLSQMLGRALIALTLLGFLMLSFATKRLALDEPAAKPTASHRR